ncbi:MAG: ABC transporter substrate-binding protein [Firmicutes bacterium]|nr:ABC transporter substrate-binding protein [Bacillota bacterium]
MSSKSRVVSILLAIAMVLTVAIGAGAAETFRVGVVGPRTGPVATYGLSVIDAVTLAVEEVNAAGGILGQQIELIVEDNKADAIETNNAFRKLISRDEVHAIIGAVVTANSIVGAQVAQMMKVPMITPTSTAEKVTEKGDYIFRSCLIDPVQAIIMANFVYNSLGFREVACLTAQSNDYSVGLEEVFTKTFRELGGTIVATESYSEGDQDFKAQLTKIRAKKPSAIYVPGYYTEAGLIARQMRQLGMDQPILGTDGFHSPKLFEIGGDAVLGSYFTNHYSIETEDEIAVHFLESYRAKYGQDPDGFAALAYDAVLVLVDAIKRAGDGALAGHLPTARAAIRDALADTKDIQAVTGTFSFDEKRNPVKSAVILRVVEDGYDFVERIDP